MKTPKQLRSLVNKQRRTESERKYNLLSALGSSNLEIRYMVVRIYIARYGDMDKIRGLMPLSSSCISKFRII